jgi:hypothetical protein
MTVKEAFTTIINDGGKITSPTNSLTTNGEYVKRDTIDEKTTLYLFDSNDNFISTANGLEMLKTTDWVEKV